MWRVVQVVGAVVLSVVAVAFAFLQMVPDVARVDVTVLDEDEIVEALPMPVVPRDTPPPTSSATPQSPSPSPEAATSSASPSPATYAPPPEGVVNILVAGSDLRRGNGNTGYGSFEGERSDSTMLVQVNPAAQVTTAVSIPRDLWVNLPSCAGGGQNKFNAAYDFGGLDCMVRMTQNLTGVKVDHVVVFDFNAFKSVVGVLGGVEVCVSGKIKDRYTDLKLSPGTHRLNPEEALAFARSRHSTVDGSDLARIDRQQYLMRRMVTELRKERLGPVGAAQMINAVLPHVKVDQRLDVGKMASVALAALNGRILTKTLPYYFSSSIPYGSVAYDADAAQSLLNGLRNPPGAPVVSQAASGVPRQVQCVS